jgi:DNA-directed RNA polymerase sigma subunit (sigma70/sigma32)
LHVDLDRGVHIATQPTQDDYAELSATLARLSGRSGDVLLRIAMGDELGEIANDYGISRERVRQIGEQARTKLRRAVA